MIYSEFIILFLLAVVANWFSALAGGGAGLIQLPLLIFMGLPFSLALATHKIATVALGLGATGRHLKEKNLPWKMIALVVVAGVPGVVAGVFFIIGVNDRHAEIVLGLLTLGLSLYSIFKPELGQKIEYKHRDTFGISIAALVLIFLGFINGALSAGSGLFVTLWLVYWLGFDYQRAVTITLIAVGLVWNLSGAISMGAIAEVKWSWLPALILGSLVGGYLGAHTSIKAGNKWIKRVYEVVTMLVGIKLLF